MQKYPALTQASMWKNVEFFMTYREVHTYGSNVLHYTFVKIKFTCLSYFSYIVKLKKITNLRPS